MNVADLLTRQAMATPDAVAVIREDRRFSYVQLEALIWGLCGHLRDRGLRTGDVVGLYLQDTLLHLAAILALARSGMTSVAVTPIVTAAGADTQAGRGVLARTGSRAILHGDARLDWGLESQILLEPDQVFALAGNPDQALTSDGLGRWMIYKTSSGTTGAPKIVGATHEGMVSSIQRELDGIGYPPGERYMTPVALRNDGPRRRYLACLAAGGTAVMPPRNGSAEAILAAIEQHDIRHFSCVPSQAYEMATAAGPGPLRFPRMRYFRLSTGPSDAPLHRLLRERLTPNILISYGCTELGPLTVAVPELVARQPQTVGHPMAGIEVEVVAADDQPQPPQTVGFIRLRAEGMPQAYHDDAEATAKYFRNGWFYPGDLGKKDDAGLLFHMGRADDMMIMNGVNIYPAEIEQTLMTHPAVRDAVALPLRHPVLNDNVPVCAVALNDGDGGTETQLLAFARARLGSHSPQRVVVLDQIPRNEHGKVQRPLLTQAIVARLRARPSPDARDAPARPRTPPLAPLGQLSVRFTVGFQVPPQPDMQRVDAWLNGALGLELVPASAGADGASDRRHFALAWLQRALLLTRLLLQASRLPVLDAPRILACRADPARGDTWLASVSLARIEEIAPVAYEIAFNGALQLCGWMLSHPVDEAGLQVLYGLMEERVLARLKPMAPLGKSTLPVLRVAHRQSIPFTHLGGGVFQLGWGCKAQRMYNSVTGRDSAIGARLAANKALTASVLRKAGLPAPVHRIVTALPAALQAAQQLGWPVVVKPADRERGEGVTVDVGDDQALKAAFEAARQLSRTKSVIVERQVAGVCHRLFIAHGKLLYAVQRGPMSIEGDGVSDIATLIDAEVAQQQRMPPWERSGIQPLDALARTAIAAAGHTTDAVPARGELVPLRRIESTEWGGVDQEVTHRIHPENLRVATAAAELFGLDMAGIDIITSDIARPWFETGAIVNEVNYAPLLGGAAISRSHIPAFLTGFVDGNGTIPVEVFVGGAAAWAAASQRWQSLVDAGRAAYLSGARRTLRPSGEEWPMPLQGLYRRTRALVLTPQVQALVLVLQTDEFLATGLPLEAVSSVRVVDDRLSASNKDGEALAPERLDALLKQVQAWSARTVAA